MSTKEKKINKWFKIKSCYIKDSVKIAVQVQLISEETFTRKERNNKIVDIMCVCVCVYYIYMYMYAQVDKKKKWGWIDLH